MRDSAGVRVVESAAPSWSAAERWTVAPAPALRIGAVDGPTPSLFSSIIGGALHPDGSVALLDRQTMEIRLFAADGSHRATFGGLGEGPGEFLRPGPASGGPIAFSGTDALLVLDVGPLRLHRFDLDGRLQGSVDLAAPLADQAPGARVGVEVWRVLADGSLLWVRDLSARDPDVINHYSVSLIRAADLALVPVAELAGSPRLHIPSEATPGLSAPGPFAPSQLATASAGPAEGSPSVFVADALHWEVRVHGADGRLVRILRLRLPRVPVTPALVASRREIYESYGPDGGRIMATLPVPDSLPAINGWRMVADEAGRLWVPHYHRDSSAEPGYVYEVLAADGRWLGQVTVPGRALAIGHDRILSVHADGFGVPYALVHEIRRGGSP